MPAAAPAPQPPSASNTLFLIAFGMFLAAAVIPVLLSAVLRSIVLLLVLLVACVLTNPTDHSFACWLSEQEDVDLRLKKEKPGVTQWFSAVVKTAIAMVTQEPLTWTYHNAIAFSVVFVPALDRYAFGCLGNWWWADKNPRLLPLCKAQWLAKYTRGGEPSGIEAYMDEDTAEQRQQMRRRAVGGRRDGTRAPRSRGDFEEVANAFASSVEELADSLQSKLSGGSSVASNSGSSRSGYGADNTSTATGSSDRALRANAVKAKISKDWKEAARLFMEASRVALSLLSRTNYRLEAAWCEVEQATSFPTRSSRLAKMVDAVCEELSSAGFFDDAARALSDFALRLKKRFPQDAQREAAAQQIGQLYLRARIVAEAGNNSRSALENCAKAAGVYAEASLWKSAEETFEAAAKMHLRADHPALASESFGNAVLCRIGQLDVDGADQLHRVHRRLVHDKQGVSECSDMDALLENTFEAFDSGSISLLESAVKRYESRQRMQPWQDLKRPLLFDVQRVKFAPIALVNRDETQKIKRRHPQRLDADESELRATELPASVLPMILHSHHAEKPVYIPSPTKTPTYFRWKPKHLSANNTAEGNIRRPSAPHGRSEPRSPSPRLAAMQIPEQVHTSGWESPPTDLQQVGPSLFEDAPDSNDACATTFTPPSTPQVVLAPLTTPEQQVPRRASVVLANLFDYGDLPTTPASPSFTSAINSRPPGCNDSKSAQANIEEDPGSTPMQSDTTKPAVASLPTNVTSVVTPAGHGPPPEQKQPSTPKILDSTPDESADKESENESDENPDETDDSVAIEFSGSGDSATRQPHEKVITQHLLRGKFLRRYLHANNLTRKLKETEQALRDAALHGGIPTMKGGGSLFSRSFVAKSSNFALPGTPGTPPTAKALVQELIGDEATARLSEHPPVLRRSSSIDKAINNTAKRIRRMSGIEDPGASSKPRRQSPPTAKPANKSHGGRTFSSLRAIGEKKSTVFAGLKEDEDKFDGFDGEDDEVAEETGLPGAKIDPSSAHMMRICQHVIAKRAIKAFLREEMSVITIIEVALRDELHLMPKWLQHSGQVLHNNGVTAAHLQQQQAHARAPTPDSDAPPSTPAPPSIPAPAHEEMHRVPIKMMGTDILESVGGYLRQGDQHMCLEEVYASAIQAEREKQWKRAILLASVCVALDLEFVHSVLLRARCCRRLGLWTQAIKDLGHAILLRPDEYKLVLLRSCLHVKMGDVENALVDANRALAFFPKCVDALLLRADIFHRQDAIGASLQDLTTALLYDPSCWRAYYDRATIRIRAIEGDEYSLNYHWEHMKYEKLLASIIEDYVNAVRKGCQMVEVVETIGDLSVQLMEFTGDSNVLRQVVNNLTHLLQILAHDHRRSFHANANGSGAGASNRSPSIANATVTVAAVAALTGTSATASATHGRDQQRSSELARELLIASIHAQRGRLFVLLHDQVGALADFDQAVVTEYHYPVAHFYRGAFATMSTTKADDPVALATHVQHLNRCISLDPTIAGAFTVRGALFLRDLKFSSALQDFKAAVATDPTLYEVWLQIALIYLNHYHDSDECIKACTSALTNDSCLARALYLRAEAFTRQGNIRAALRDYGRLTIAQPDDRWAQLMRGRLLMQMTLARPALYAFIQFMELGAYAHEQRRGDAGTAAEKRTHLLCGRAYKILTRFQQAVDQFQRAVSLNPTSENLVLLSESLHSMGDTENSLRVSEKVINAAPNSYEGYVRRAQLLVTVGQFQRAMGEYNTAAALAPKESRVLYERGIVQMQLYLRWRVAFQVNFEDKARASKLKRKRHRSAFEPRLAAIEVEATLGADQINDENTVLENMKTFYAGAIGDFCKCIRLDPLMSEPYVDRAELYVLGEDFDKAFQDLHTAVDRNPKCVRAHVNLGVLKCQFAAFASAIADFDLAIRHDPKLALAYFNRAVCYQKLELFRHAVKSYTSCIAIAGKGRDVDAHCNRAIALCHTGHAFEDALADFDEVRQSAPDDDQLHGGLGYVLLQLGKYGEAARCFATYGRLSRDTLADSANAYFNLASNGSLQPSSSSSSSSSSVAGSIPLDQKKYDGYLDKALRLYLRATRLHPSNLDLRLNIANCLRRLNEPLKAVSQCDAIYKVKPLHHAGLESKSLCFYQMHRLPEAIEWMDEAIRACVGSSSALQNIFYAFAHSSIHRHALDRRTVGEQRSESRTPEKSETMAQAMSAQLQELKQRRLVPSADGDSELSPLQPLKPVSTTHSAVVLTGSSKQLLALYMVNRGILYEKMGAWDDAARDYLDAVHFDPLSVQPLLCLATLKLLERRYEESRSAFEKALELEPKNGLAQLNLGVVCLCTDNVDEALSHFEQAIEALPTCSYAYANKAVALAKKGELKLAETQLKRAIEELPARKEYYLVRGKIIAQQKRLQDAMVDFSTALFLGYEGRL